MYTDNNYIVRKNVEKIYTLQIIGAGLASVCISFLMSTYYCVIIAYAIYYFFTSFRPVLPWTDCSHRWNTPDCWIPERLEHNLTRPVLSRTPAEEFFEYV